MKNYKSKSIETKIIYTTSMLGAGGMLFPANLYCFAIGSLGFAGVVGRISEKLGWDPDISMLAVIPGAWLFVFILTLTGAYLGMLVGRFILLIKQLFNKTITA
jgi:hypothetical protein